MNTKEHFYSFKAGQTALLLGEKITVVRQDGESWWDDENFPPLLEIAYWDKAGVYHSVSLSPYQVLSQLKHIGETK